MCSKSQDGYEKPRVYWKLLRLWLIAKLTECVERLEVASEASLVPKGCVI